MQYEGYTLAMKNQNLGGFELHPLTTWATMARISASYARVSGLSEFAFLSDASEAQVQSRSAATLDPFVDDRAAYAYLDAHTEKHVFLAVGELSDDLDVGMVDVVILIPGENPIFYSDGDGIFCYDDRWAYLEVVQANRLHRVKSGKLGDLSRYLDDEMGCGMELKFVPTELYHSVDIGISMLDAIQQNCGSELVKEIGPTGRTYWSISAFTPFASKA